MRRMPQGKGPHSRQWIQPLWTDAISTNMTELAKLMKNLSPTLMSSGFMCVECYSVGAGVCSCVRQSEESICHELPISPVMSR